MPRFPTNKTRKYLHDRSRCIPKKKVNTGILVQCNATEWRGFEKSSLWLPMEVAFWTTGSAEVVLLHSTEIGRNNVA